jgi:hypothetical protein
LLRMPGLCIAMSAPTTAISPLSGTTRSSCTNT